MTDTYFLVPILTAMAVIMAVMLHYEISVLLTRWVSVVHLSHRRRILMLVFGLLLLHITEISLFGAIGWLLVEVMKTGQVVGQVSFSFQDYVYFSAVTYTTVGYGDLWAQGPVRFLYAIESLVGLVLITWSASLTFLEMQRYWDINARGKK